MVPARVLLIGSHLREEDPLHGLDEEDSHAQAHPGHQEVVGIAPQDPPQDGEGYASEGVPPIREHVQQRRFPAAHRVQQPLQQHKLQHPADQTPRELQAQRFGTKPEGNPTGENGSIMIPIWNILQDDDDDEQLTFREGPT